MSKKKLKLQDEIHDLFDKYEMTDMVLIYRTDKEGHQHIEYNCETGYMLAAARAVIDLYNLQPKTEEPRIILQ